MQINSLPPGFGGVFGSTAPRASSAGASSSASGVVPDRAELLSARRKLLRVLESLDEVQRLTSGGSSILSGLPSARSDPALNLDLTATAASLRSIAEINATPTSFSPFVPEWGGGSSAFLTIGGVYDGSNGSGVLSFEARNGGVHGVDRLRIRIRDASNAIVNTVTIRDTHPIDRQYDIGNGLFFTLSAGALERFDTTSIQISDTVGSSVDPDKPFNGTGNDNPNYEFGLPGIVDGTFKVNGATISVSASDTLNDVLGAINQSAADVTAVFNPQTERIEMTHNTLGAAGTIDVEAGDSNFVAATKLLDAVLDPGVDPDTGRPLQSVAQFAGVSSGSIVVNGTEITVDAESDSLDDIIARINASDAGAEAAFDAETQRVVITGQHDGEELVIDGNGTGLFGALNIPQGRVDPGAEGRGYSQRRAQRIVNAMGDAMSALNEFFQESRSSGRENRQVAGLRSQLASAFASILGSGESRVETRVGLSFNLDAVGKQYSRFVTLDRARLSQQLQTRGSEVDRFLNGSSAQEGLLQNVGAAAQQAFQSLSSTLGTRGTLFDAYA